MQPSRVIHILAPEVRSHTHTVYFRISLKRGKCIVANFKRGKFNPRGQPHINIGKANCLGRGANQFQGGAKAPPGLLLNHTHTHTHSTYMAFIGVHKIHGQVHSN